MERERPAGTDPERRASPGERRSLFLARVTASATHEFRNILAIVKESSGLVEDLVIAAGTGPPNRDKIDWALGRIRLQVTRGSDLATSLNRVMHGLDHPVQELALQDTTEHAGLLAQRFARQQSRRIEVREGSDDLVVTANALDLYRGLVEVMEWCVARVPEGSAVVVETRRLDGRGVLRFRPDPDSDVLATADPADRTALDAAVVDLPAGTRLEEDGSLLLVFEEMG